MAVLHCAAETVTHSGFRETEAEIGIYALENLWHLEGETTTSIW